MRANIDPSKRALQEIDINQSQSDSQNTVSSSMETVPTDFIDGCFSEPDEEVEEIKVWGRLFPLSPSFDTYDMKKEEYSFGRGENCDYQFQFTDKKQTAIFQTYSKVHFKIKRENTSTGIFTFLEDLSSNGTFVNQEKVGKNCVQALKNNDQIAISLEKNKAFLFIDSVEEQDSLPVELKQKYVMSKVLGTGAYGVVKLAFEKGTSKGVAIKCISKISNCSTDMSSYIQREIKILKSLQHPCIVSVLDVIDGEDKMYIVLELVEGGELFDRLTDKDGKGFTEREAKLLFYQIATAMKYLHDQNIAHRDLKLENIMVCSKTSNETLVKVNDFGVSKFIDTQTKLKTFVGTPQYLAPEILQSRGMSAYTNAVDVWSLGVMLYGCLVGYLPFNSTVDEDDKDNGLSSNMVQQIIKGKYDFPRQHWKDVSKEAISLIKGMLTCDPEKRITVEGMLKHEWMQDKTVIETAEKLMFGNLDMAPPSASVSTKKRKLNEEDGPSKK